MFTLWAWLRSFLGRVTGLLRGRPYLNVILVASTSGLSKVVGLLRDRLLASYFGAGPITDAYVAAFRLPDLIFNTLILGAFAAACIPLLVRVRKYGLKIKDRSGNIQNIPDADGINVFTSQLLNWFLLLVSALVLILWVFAPNILSLVITGFEPENFNLTVLLTRIMLFSVPLFTISNIFTATLTAEQRFWSISWSPIFYNLGLILGIGLAGLTQQYFWLGGGVLLGAAGHLIIQWPELRSIKWRWIWRYPIKNLTNNQIQNYWTWSWSHTSTQLVKLMIPRTLSLAISQINLTVATFLMTGFGPGRLSAFYFSNNVQSVPLSLIGISFSLVAFPILAQAFEDDKPDDFVKHLENNLALMFFILVPMAVLFVVLRAHIVRLILGAGVFDWEATYFTAQTLGLLAIALIPQSLIPLLTKALFARGNTQGPLRVSLITFVLNLIGMFLSGKYFGFFGVITAYALITWIDAGLLFWRLSLAVKNLSSLAWPIIKHSFWVAITVGPVAYLGLQLGDVFFDNRYVIGLLLQCALSAILALSAWLLVEWTSQAMGWNLIIGFVKKWRRLRAIATLATEKID